MAAPGLPHTIIHGRVATGLTNALDRAGRDCFVMIGPGVIPAIRSRINFRVPDIVVTGSAIGGERATPDPVLTVEILAPGNWRESWEAVRNHLSIPSMMLVMIVDSRERRVQLFERAEGGWTDEPTGVPLDRPLALAPLGIEVDPAEFYRGVPTA